MRRLPNRELWYSAAIVLALTGAYVAAFRFARPLVASSALVGHGLGVFGIALMLMAETLYSIRKRLSAATWGSGAAWLRFHIVTGLVGAWAVLLHTGFAFSGLAGISATLTAIVVVSGVVGRYLFTTVPRRSPSVSAAAEGIVAPTSSTSRDALAVWRMVHVPLTWVLFATAFVHAIAALYYATLQR